MLQSDKSPLYNYSGGRTNPSNPTSCPNGRSGHAQLKVWMVYCAKKVFLISTLKVRVELFAGYLLLYRRSCGLVTLSYKVIQWNSSIAATLGEQKFGRYNYSGAWPLLRGCFVHKLFIWDLDSWPLYRGGLYSGVAVKRGSNVYRIIA